jgi:hypothetical protein
MDAIKTQEQRYAQLVLVVGSQALNFETSGNAAQVWRDVCRARNESRDLTLPLLLMPDEEPDPAPQVVIPHAWLGSIVTVIDRMRLLTRDPRAAGMQATPGGLVQLPQENDGEALPPAGWLEQNRLTPPTAKD